MATGRITGTVQLGGAPTQLAMGADRTRAYVVDYDRVEVLCTLTHKVIDTITVGSRPSSVAVGAGGGRLHVADYTGDVPTEVQVYQAAIDHGVPFFGPSDLDISEGMEYFTAAMEAALSRSKTPQQALDDFVREANRAVFGN